MSAQLAHLEPQLEWAVSQGVISLAEAWTLQDFLALMPEDQPVEAPDLLAPAIERIWLLEEPAANRLPI